MPQEHDIVWYITNEMNDERRVSPEEKKKKNYFFFSSARAWTISLWKQSAQYFQKLSTAADSEGGVHILKQMGKDHFIFLSLLVKKNW